MKKQHGWMVGLVLIGLVLALAGCGGEAMPESAGSEVGQGYTSEVLDTAYDGALSVSNQLALGTLLLEETEEAVTPDQAAALLPLWQALHGGVTAEAEVNALLKQIEGTMAQGQLEAIAAMALTREDQRGWMEEQGIQMAGPGGMGGGPPAGGEMPPDVATRRAEMENMTEEDRAALRETRQAGGGRPGGMGGGGDERFVPAIGPLIELLEARAAE